jgi:hypothetical protein
LHTYDSLTKMLAIVTHMLAIVNKCWQLWTPF